MNTGGIIGIGNLKKYPENFINIRNKKTMKQLNEETIQRLEIFKKASYNVKFIWESDWREKNKRER